MVAAVMLNLFQVASYCRQSIVCHLSTINSVKYLIPQMSCRNEMRFKMAAIFDFRKTDY